MIKSLVYLFIGLIGLTLVACGGDDSSETPEPSGRTVSDISVTSSVSRIVWMNQDDLDAQVNNAISFNSANTEASEVQTSIQFNATNTQVTATIDFLDQFRANYIDPNVSNNSVTIELEEFDDGELNGIGASLLVADDLCFIQI